jgi:hypothetical protein
LPAVSFVSENHILILDIDIENVVLKWWP